MSLLCWTDDDDDGSCPPQHHVVDFACAHFQLSFVTQDSTLMMADISESSLNKRSDGKTNYMCGSGCRFHFYL